MKRFAFLACFLASLWCHSALADELKNFGTQVSYFYLTPTPEAFDVFQKNAERFRNEFEKAGKGYDVLVAVMIARISQQNNWPISAGIIGLRAKEIVDGQSRLAKYVADDTQVNAAKLDIWWASFFATGDEVYLANILQYAGLELPKADVERMLIIQAASWSFKANCRQHPKVLAFARQRLASPHTSEAQTKFIRDAIAFAEIASPAQ
ncbi:hypothetical protein ACFFKC_11055 [Pseudoduganella danionis]|uniref:Transglycosylase SLT domain-containing protein n=1 Tax=Pseudoduganella danionis TaxID=1890295 RepID=A0ABW9SJV1_9BURK|nr:hypothetical protein [Pseudoduganella danionis]MTW32441.1 hypothetical protein [Pseudoduganella danionis]